MAVSGGSFGPTGGDMQAILKGYELFRILLHEKIPLKEKCRQIGKLLNGSNVSVNFLNEHGGRNTLLHVAVANGYVDIVDILIDNHADVNIQNADGDTPLHVAVAQDNIVLVGQLRVHNADVTISNTAGETPLDLANKKNMPEIVAMLSGNKVVIQYTSDIMQDENTVGVESHTSPRENHNQVSADVFANLPKTHAASGAKHSLHGTIYQLKLLMLFVVRALRNGYKFRLATEMDEAEKFDDLVFQYQLGNEIKSLYLQAKHKQNASKGRITLGALLSENGKDPFSLHKYYDSYLKIKKRIGLEAENIDFVICTNTDFHFDEHLKLKGDEGVFTFQDVKTSYSEFFREGKCYKFVLDDVTLKLLHEIFGKTMIKEQLADEKSMSTGSCTILETDNKIEDSVDPQVETDNTKKEDNEDNEEIEKSKANVAHFFSKLIFAMGQPNEVTLGKIIKTEFGESNSINLLDADLYTDSLYRQMLEWLKEKGPKLGHEGTFLSNETAQEFVNHINLKINNLISTGISTAYPEYLKTLGIIFCYDKINELNDLIAKHGILHLKTADETRLTSIKVVQALEQSGKYGMRDSYLFMRLTTLTGNEIQERYMNAFKSIGSHDLLVVVCFLETDMSPDFNSKSTLNNNLLQILSANVKKRIIFIAEENHPLPQKFAMLPKYYAHEVNNEFKDLTSEAQDTVLATQVLFQGYLVQLDAIINKSETELLKSVSIEALIGDTPLAIGTELPSCNGYNDRFYINRSLSRHVIIHSSKFFKAVSMNIFSEKVAHNENDFIRLCQERPPHENVHLIEKWMMGNLIWIKSRGSPAKLRDYIDTDRFNSYPEQSFLASVETQKVIIISDSAGMGKSTVVTHISKQMKENDPSALILRIDLNNYTDDLRQLVDNKFDSSSSLDFLFNHLKVITSPLEKALFQRGDKVVLFFDGFDEISPDYNEVVMDLIDNLRAATKAQLYITTRPFMREELENKLQQLSSFTLDPFSKTNQLEFLIKYWNQYMITSKDGHQNRVTKFATSLVERLSTSISDAERVFTGIPLQIRMLAECFVDDVKSFLDSDLTEPILGDDFNLAGLYEKFIVKKFEVYHREKAKADDSNVVVKSIHKLLYKLHMNNHQLLALALLFSEQQIRVLDPNYESPINSGDILSDLNKIGIVNVIKCKPHFLHRTFTEYFVASFFFKMMLQFEKRKEINEFIVNEILIADNCRVIRAFINGLLESNQPQDGELKKFGDLIVSKWEEKEKIQNCGKARSYSKYDKLAVVLTQRENNAIIPSTELGKSSGNVETKPVSIFHQAAEEGNHHILAYLCNSVNKTHPSTLQNMLLCTDGNGTTLLQLAVIHNQAKVVTALLQWASENLDHDQGQSIMKSLIMATNMDGETLLHVGEKKGHVAVIVPILNWIHSNLVLKQDRLVLRSLLLASENTRKQTFLHFAAHYNRSKSTEKVLQWIHENLSVVQGRSILKSLLTATDKNYKCTVFLLAARHGHKEMMEMLLRWTRDNMAHDKEILKSVLLATDEMQWTALHYLAFNGHSAALQMLLQWTCDNMEQDNSDHAILSSFLMKGARDGGTVLHRASYLQQPAVPVSLLQWIHDKMGQNQGEAIITSLLLARDIVGRTVLHWTALHKV